MASYDFLPESVRRAFINASEDICEIRLRRRHPIRLTSLSGKNLTLPELSDREFSLIASSLMGHSIYARENELSEGFLTLENGWRAGISGTFSGKDRRIQSIDAISCICIRIAHEIKGCADNIMDIVNDSSGLLIISPPGIGKTTLLRDIVRQLSFSGSNITLMDERGEIAPQGVDVGPCTDIYSMLPKSQGITMAIRTMAPDVIAVDELGAPEDIPAVHEAARSGVKIIATAHGSSLDLSKMRKSVGILINDLIFDTAILLGPSRGNIQQIIRLNGGNHDR